MSQDEGSDSEPELVVQARGHWEKNLGVRTCVCVRRTEVARGYPVDRHKWQFLAVELG